MQQLSEMVRQQAEEKQNAQNEGGTISIMNEYRALKEQQRVQELTDKVQSKKKLKFKHTTTKN